MDWNPFRRAKPPLLVCPACDAKFETGHQNFGSGRSEVRDSYFRCPNGHRVRASFTLTGNKLKVHEIATEAEPEPEPAPAPRRRPPPYFITYDPDAAAEWVFEDCVLVDDSADEPDEEVPS